MSRVVLIEDDEGISETLCLNLEWAGHHVLAARDAAGGLRLAQTCAPDVVLLDLDLMMPGREGFEVARWLRGSSTVPVIMLTSRERGELDAAAGLEVGPDDCIAKPFSVGEVLARITSVQRRGGSEATANAGTEALSI